MKCREGIKEREEQDTTCFSSMFRFVRYYDTDNMSSIITDYNYSFTICIKSGIFSIHSQLYSSRDDELSIPTL